MSFESSKDTRSGNKKANRIIEDVRPASIILRLVSIACKFF